MTDEEIRATLAALLDSGDLVRVGEDEFSMTEVGVKRVNKLLVARNIDPNDQQAVTEFLKTYCSC